MLVVGESPPEGICVQVLLVGANTCVEDRFRALLGSDLCGVVSHDCFSPGFIQKPYDLSTLRAAIRAALEGLPAVSG